MNTKGYNRIKERVFKHIDSLPKSSDKILITLKGHLLIEEEMNRMIKIIFKKPNYILKKNFTFFRKLCVLRACVVQTEKCIGLWLIIEDLNTIRNYLGHNLSPKELSDKLKKLFVKIKNSNAEYKSYRKPEWSETERIRQDLGFIAAVLAGLSDSFLKENNNA